MSHVGNVYNGVRMRAMGNMDIEGGEALPLSSLGVDPKHGIKTFSRHGSASPVSGKNNFHL